VYFNWEPGREKKEGQEERWRGGEEMRGEGEKRVG
jgi:hypothetical protein